MAQTLTYSLQEAWLRAAQDARQRLAVAEMAQALFTPEWTAEARRDLNHALTMLKQVSA